MAVRKEVMAAETILVTGAAGEVGHGLIKYFSADPQRRVVALDLRVPGDLVISDNVEFIQGSILDDVLLRELNAKYDFSRVFHLAGVLSTGGEKNPQLAHQINVEGSFKLLNLAKAQSERRHSSVRFIFPSTIAVYGLPAGADKLRCGIIKEDQWVAPRTIYGINKLYVEQLGGYYGSSYKLLDHNQDNVKLDFRALRFPGLLSAETVPTGGTTDYGSEMLHYAAQGRAYECFVTGDTKLPFMTMPDAVQALMQYSATPKERLTRQVYNVGSFSVSALQIAGQVQQHFPASRVSYVVNADRQAICDSWPADLDDSAARKDWGWRPDFDFSSAFRDYLVPGVKRHYALAGHIAKT